MRITTIIYGFIFMHIGVAHYLEAGSHKETHKEIKRQAQERFAKWKQMKEPIDNITEAWPDPFYSVEIAIIPKAESLYNNLETLIALTPDPFNLDVSYRDTIMPLKNVVLKKLELINERVNYFIHIGNTGESALSPIDNINAGCIGARTVNCFRIKVNELLAIYEKIINLLPPGDQGPFPQWLAEAKDRSRNW
jgi:hypothetical protein